MGTQYELPKIKITVKTVTFSINTPSCIFISFYNMKTAKLQQYCESRSRQTPRLLYVSELLHVGLGGHSKSTRTKKYTQSARNIGLRFVDLESDPPGIFILLCYVRLRCLLTDFFILFLGYSILLLQKLDLKRLEVKR